jgi:hypothetical protein
VAHPHDQVFGPWGDFLGDEEVAEFGAEDFGVTPIQEAGG